MRSSALALLAAAAASLAPCPALAGDDTVAVLSSEGGVYLEAFSAFQAEYGGEVRRFDYARGRAAIPPGTGTIVTFGIKAMAQEYPKEANVISCLAPGYIFRQEGRAGRAVKISMMPSFPDLFAALKRVQPRLKRLIVFWMAENYGGFRSQFTAAGEQAGLQVTAVKVSSVGELPALLRGARAEMDAFFLPPDPFLISPESLMIFREFSWSNGIPMYATTKGIAREGATASVGISFAESGAAAARAAKGLRSGEALPAVIFPDKMELTLNAAAARKCGIELPSDLIKDAVHLFP